MRWVDIEQSARTYKDSIQEPQITPEPVIQTLSLDEIEAQKQTEVDEIFRNFAVKECLEAIAADVWGEGEVKKDGTLFTGGFFGMRGDRDEGISLNNELRLVSNDFAKVVVSESWPERQRQLYIQPGAVNINVGVMPNHFRGDKWQIEVSTHSLYKLEDPDLDIKGYLMSHTLNATLKYALSLDDKRRGEPSTEFAVDQLGALGLFHASMFDQVELLRYWNCFPAQVRAWSEQRVGQLPTDWIKNRKVESTQIFDWAYQIKGTPGFIRNINSRFGYRLPV